ncbi:MAG: hypothetical protein AAF471_03980 [Myxococcota bacterium]
MSGEQTLPSRASVRHCPRAVTARFCPMAVSPPQAAFIVNMTAMESPARVEWISRVDGIVMVGFSFFVVDSQEERGKMVGYSLASVSALFRPR